MKIELVYASPTKQCLHQVDLPEGSTVQQAIEASPLLAEFPEIEFHQNTIGIFGKKTTLSTPLTSGDRIEIYRPLLIDPMQKRRLRAHLAEKQKRTTS